MKMDKKISGQVRTQWLAVGGALVVLAGVLVAWALDRAGDRVQVVQVARAVPAGQALSADDLTVTGIAFDAPIEGLVPATAAHELEGRVAAVDLQPGTLLLVGMWRDEVALGAGEARVGVVLKPGRMPEGLARGDAAYAAAMDTVSTDAPVAVRVLDAATESDGTTALTLAIPVADAVAIARLAAADLLVLVGVAQGQALPTPASDVVVTP